MSSQTDSIHRAKQPPQSLQYFNVCQSGKALEKRQNFTSRDKISLSSSTITSSIILQIHMTSNICTFNLSSTLILDTYIKFNISDALLKVNKISLNKKQKNILKNHTTLIRVETRNNINFFLRILYKIYFVTIHFFALING